MTAQHLAIIRLTGREDAGAIACIYDDQGSADRIATFETEPRTPSDIERLLAEQGDRYPTIIVVVTETAARCTVPAREWLTPTASRKPHA